MALPQSMDPELRRRIEAAADRSDTTVDEWIERAARHELDREALDEDDEIVEPLPGMKPVGSKAPVRLRDGMTVSDAVIEDRR